MESKLEKYASEAYQLVLKTASDESSTYAGDGFQKGIIGGAAIGAGKPLYNWATKGIKPNLVSPFKKSVAGSSLSTAVLWGIGGGLAGGLIKRKTQTQNEDY